jgi:small basic protein
MFDIPLDPAQGAAFLLVALLMPIIVSLVKQSGFSSRANALLAIAVYAAFAVVGALVSNIPLDYQHLTPLIIIAALVGRAAYSMFWSQVGGGDNAASIDQKITDKTSIVK